MLDMKPYEGVESNNIHGVVGTPVHDSIFGKRSEIWCYTLMATSPNGQMVQTRLNFNPKRTNAADGKKPPAIVRQAQSNVDIAKDETGSNIEEGTKSQEMEGIQSTQNTVLSWPTTVGSQDTQLVDDESIARLRKMELRRKLVRVAQETTKILPGLLSLTSHAPPKGYLYSPPQPPRLHQNYCPNFGPTAIRIHDADTLDTAIGLAQCAKYITVRDKRPVCILNMANAYNAGGGWKNGALAQEESVCYRSSLSFTLKLRYYPLPEYGAIYSPSVIVIRKSMKDGHELYPLDKPEEFPVVSAISVAALSQPRLKSEDEPGTSSGYWDMFADPADREATKEKMRVILRTAAYNGHRRLVLGALGCGAFLNPREEVADCWAEVFAEQEFSGGWWESIIFAVMDDLDEGENGDGNFGVFFRRLNGMMV